MTNSGKENGTTASMKRLLCIIIFFLLLATTGLAAGIYFKVVPSSFVEKIPFVSQYISPQNSSNDSSNTAQQPATAEQLPANDGNSNNVQPAITQNGTTNPPANTSSGVNSNSPNSQNQTNRNISKVSQIYSGMKPEEAVAILNNLDNPTIITVLQKMDEGQAAKILALMNPQHAAVLSKTLLQYHSESN